jgi:undecaprenyl-diphosphatase
MSVIAIRQWFSFLKRNVPVPLLALFFAAGLIVICAKIAEEILERDLHDFDRALLLALRHPEDPSKPAGPLWLQVAARDVTGLGSPAVLTVITVVGVGFLMLKRQWPDAVLLLITAAGGAAISSVLKLSIQRARPDFAAEVAQTQTFSFPSGHAFLSAALFLTLGALLARVQDREVIKMYVLMVSIVLALLVGVSRVYLGVHWPTDVLAGWCAGAAWAIVCWTGASLLQSRRDQK